jgi:ubiquinone/menaquinone biosynthesis C-methylase UbiE
MTTTLITLYNKLCDTIPGFRKLSRKWMYQAMGHFIKQEDWKFMNYGYSDLTTIENPAKLDQLDEENRLSYQLYNQLTTDIVLHNKQILEVGSGRGGGASMIKKYHMPEMLVGLDFSGAAVKFCKKNHTSKGLVFVEGDAENMPFGSESFDVVINVESSHCYYSMFRFLNQVIKVLRSDGYFLFTDFRKSGEVEELERQIAASGMKVLIKRDITPNVLKALDEDNDRRIMTISQKVPKFFIKQFHEFAGVKDSIIYKQFEQRELLYLSYIMIKTS